MSVALGLNNRLCALLKGISEVSFYLCKSKMKNHKFVSKVFYDLYNTRHLILVWIKKAAQREPVYNQNKTTAELAAA